MREFEVISVGDITTDALVRLSEAHAHVYEDDRGQWLVLPFATKIPFDEAFVLEAVGNAGNAAVAMARLGLATSLVTNVGGDRHGIDMIHALHQNHVDTRFVRVNPGRASNYHYALWYENERTILVKHEEFDYHWPHLSDGEVPSWLYFSSVSEHTADYHQRVADWLEEHPTTKLAFQPGTFQLEAGPVRLERIYRAAEVLVLNREEAVLVSGGDHADLHGLLDRLHKLGPRVVVITDGPSGAYASDGTGHLAMPPFPDPGPPLERTGAGDAFAATFVAALIKGRPVTEALRWAPVNAMNVVQFVGSQQGLLTAEAIEAHLRDAPDGYAPRPF
jgi:sugar/nucleoside kinase (ribokinase family)